ncbi:MAG: TolC family protein [Nitrospina sp.]|jgi:cobalt-zinc-cadmium efflux system outer membrane protein|nr:TolC family protein [Nitrospina sp.]MBT6717238.1 TolC family protein [Nitrospina sp.]
MKIFFIRLVIIVWVFIPCTSFAEPETHIKKEPKEPITLKSAVALALMHNPHLEAFSFEKRAKEARALQSGFSPNPKLDISVEDAGGSGGFSGFDQSQTTIQLSQLIELGGKRAARLRSSNLSKKLADWDYETKRMDVLTQVAKSYALVLKAQQQVMLTEDLVKLSEQFLVVVDERIKAGKVAALEKIKSEINLSSLKIEFEKVKRELKVARRNLSITWGAITPQFETALGDLNQISNIPSLEILKTRLSKNPDLARWSTELEQRQAALESEISKSIPDIEIQGGFRRLETTDDNALVFGISIPLQFFNRNQGAIEEARHKLGKAEAQKRAKKASTEKKLLETYSALDFYRTQVSSIKNQILPGAKKAFNGIQEGYRFGKFNLIDVLDSQKTFFHTKKTFLDSLAQYHNSVADLERLIGEPLASLNPALSQLKGEGS